MKKKKRKAYHVFNVDFEKNLSITLTKHYVYQQ